MFERYTEKARRTIFFARYEASEFGSPYIETEHLLLGLLREDKALANRFLRWHASCDAIREQVEKHTPPGKKVSTAVDLPLSQDCKLVLKYGAEEAERLNHQHIGTEHLLLGLLREDKCFAARLLGEQGLTVDLVRAHFQQLDPQLARDGSSMVVTRVDVWLAECEARGGVSVLTGNRGTYGTAQFAIRAVDQGTEGEEGQDLTPAEKAAQIQRRIKFITQRMENAVAHHEFEKARFYSDEERKESEALHLLREQFKPDELAQPQAPFLCIDIIRDERFSEVQKRCDEYLAEGVAAVWLLEADLKRAYTVSKEEGLREVRSGVLRMEKPPLEMDLKKVFD